MDSPLPPAVRDYVAYYRKSKGRAGVARQRRDCQLLCERIGGRIVAEFTDTDRTAFAKVGAGPTRRDDYRAMLDMLRADNRPTPLGVLAWHADRLHRNPSESETFVTVCASGNHPVETARSGSYDLTTPTGRKRFRNDVVDAAYEVDHMIERIESMKAEAARDGRWLGGRRPFGYEDDGVTVRPAEAVELRDMADRLLDGWSLNGIARNLNARGVPTSTGKSWTGRSVRQVLARPRNAGIMEHRREEVGKANWPAILDEPTWRTVVALVSAPERRTSPGGARRWMGSGLYECGVCEANGELSTLVVGTAGAGRTASRTTIPAYICQKYEGQKHVVRSAEHLDRYVTMHVIERLSRPDAAELAMGRQADDTARARVIEREALRLREQEAGEMYAAGEMTRAQLVTANQRIAARRAELDQLDAAEARVTALTPFREGDPAHVWEGLDLDQRRAVVAELMRVVVLPASKGRPAGWTPEYGKVWGYFNPDAVRITGLI
ncbi:recombinase family protein [Streptosporangium sandarakinum]|uniref:recombinase family protein n=1 Tax=Streptosporangium sandarakinum TaxID=1260955 RepID=UPI003D89EA21